MNATIRKISLGVALAATTLVAAVPAQAQWRGGWGRPGFGGGPGWNRGRGGGAGPAIVAGIAGLAVGAAIASNNNRWRGGFGPGFNGGFDPRFNGGFGPGFNGGFDPRFQRGFYDPRFNGGAGFYNYGYGYGGGYVRCFIETHWDPYYQVPVRVRVCH